MGDGGGEEDLSHASRGGGGGGGGGSVTHVPSKGWGRKISARYPVGEAQSDTCT